MRLTLCWVLAASAVCAQDARMLVLLPGPGATAESAEELRRSWEPVARAGNWSIVCPLLPEAPDAALEALEALVPAATGAHLAGFGAAVPQVFLAANRLPSLWAGALAIGGDPGAAVNTGRLYAVNGRAVPLVWARPAPGSERARMRLAKAGYPLEIREEASDGELIQWLAAQRFDPHPRSVDCETDSPQLLRCHWIEVARIDLAQRNDALKQTRVQPGSGATLDLGPFGYDPADAGPGIQIAWLPEGYRGALRLGDRIVAIEGQTLKNAAAYAEYLDERRESGDVALMIERAGKRSRVEAKVVRPPRPAGYTVRVQGEIQGAGDERELILVSRGVSVLRITPPPGWLPLQVLWNGDRLEAAGGHACWELDRTGEPRVQPCAVPK
ncbi:MAG: hypothetical protein IPM24_18415 [Bryobacterales bacterium]|nr:hypothetical protein [Bryobacterales bacterium]